MSNCYWGNRRADSLALISSCKAMSGKTVKPKLYLALGISGAFQHIVGLRDTNMIVAINRDAKAPIFANADYGIVDDILKFVPILTQRINYLKG